MEFENNRRFAVILFLISIIINLSTLNIAARTRRAVTDFAKVMFRTLFHGRPVTGGTRKFRIENTFNMEQQLAGYGWTAECNGNIPPQTKK